MVSRLPKNLDELSTAIADTKKSIFSQYDSMAKGAGEAGRGSVVNLKTIEQSKVPLSGIASELDNVVNNKVVRDNAPEVVKYAEQRANVFRDGSYTPQEAQDAIKIYNDNLQAFYRNPSAELASKISVDALIVNKMRQALDETVSGLQGSGYQSLKKQYGALSSIEKDVSHRAVVEARKNAKGLVDYADMFSAADVVHGVLSGNPILIARGGAVQAVKGFIKSANSSVQATLCCLASSWSSRHSRRSRAPTPTGSRPCRISRADSSSEVTTNMPCAKERLSAMSSRSSRR